MASGLVTLRVIKARRSCLSFVERLGSGCRLSDLFCSGSSVFLASELEGCADAVSVILNKNTFIGQKRRSLLTYYLLLLLLYLYMDWSIL
jgi:hypothetical protein